MKKVLLMITLPVCLVMGQDQPELPGWGVYVGYGMMGATGDDFDPDSMTTLNAPGFGVSKGVWLGGMPLQVGVGLHPRGWKMEADFGDLTMSDTWNLQYLDLWAQMPYPLGPVFLGVGVNVGMYVGGTVETELKGSFLGEDFNESESYDLESDAMGLDYGLNLGVAYPIGDTGAQVGVLYVLGLVESNAGATFNGLFFNAGYSF